MHKQRDVRKTRDMRTRRFRRPSEMDEADRNQQGWENFDGVHGQDSPSFLNRLFTSLKWKSSEQSFSSSPFLKCFATSGSAFRTSRKSASSRPACLTSHVFIAPRWTSA